MHQNRNYAQFNFNGHTAGMNMAFRTTKMHKHPLKSPGNDQPILSKKQL
jgi:hypothetical protein